MVRRSQAYALDSRDSSSVGEFDVVLVQRVRGDPVVRDLVHLLGTDLQFDALLARADHGGVNGAVIILLRGRDVILEAARHHRPRRMNDPERLVALG